MCTRIKTYFNLSKLYTNMPIEKNLPKIQESTLIVPEELQKRKSNYENAGYKYTFEPLEQQYIKYNTLRSKRQDQELLSIVKIYRLKDRDSDDEFLVYNQSSKVTDYNNNLIKCPIDEQLGVIENPKTNRIKNENDEVIDIQRTETHNEYTIPFSKSKLEELFKKSRNSNNIVCYVGFTKNPKTGDNDFIEGKKLIRNQEAFVNRSIDELLERDSSLNMKKSYNDKKEMRKLKENTESKVDQQEERLEGRVKDSGQLWEEDTSVISERMKAEQAEELKQQKAKDNEVKSEPSEPNKSKESGNNNNKLRVGKPNN